MPSMTLSSELFWMTLSILFTGLMWVPYILNRMWERGVGAALHDAEGTTDTKIAWAERMMRAHQNAVENLVVFAPLVLALHITGNTGATSALACMVYFFARVAHFLMFTLGFGLLRVVSFGVGVAAQIVLAVRLLGAG